MDNQPLSLPQPEPKVNGPNEDPTLTRREIDQLIQDALANERRIGTAFLELAREDRAAFDSRVAYTKELIGLMAKLATLFGSILIIVLGFVGWDSKKNIEEDAKAQIRAQLDTSKQKVADAIENQFKKEEIQKLMSEVVAKRTQDFVNQAIQPLNNKVASIAEIAALSDLHTRAAGGERKAYEDLSDMAQGVGPIAASARRAIENIKLLANQGALSISPSEQNEFKRVLSQAENSIDSVGRSLLQGDSVEMRLAAARVILQRPFSKVDTKLAGFLVRCLAWDANLTVAAAAMNALKSGFLTGLKIDDLEKVDVLDRRAVRRWIDELRRRRPDLLF